MAHLLIWGKASDLLAGAHPVRHSEEVQTLDALLAELDGKTAALVLVDPDRLAAEPEKVEAWQESNGRLQTILVAVTNPDQGDAVLERFPFLDDVLARPVTPVRLERKLKQAGERINLVKTSRQLEGALYRRSNELSKLNEIGVALSAQRDIDQLLELILKKSRELTWADAGSLYLVEPDEDNGPTRPARLRFKLAQNDTVDVPFKESTLPLDERTMAGYAAIHGKLENVADAYRLPPDSPYQFSRTWDEKSGYRTKSMLTVPMRDHKDEVIGVVQLINKKRRRDTVLRPVSIVEEEVIPFISVDQQLVDSLASQAAVAYRNAALLKNIRELFENFVTAAVTAIEKRDPATSGHSERVAILTVDLAERVDKVSSGPLADVRLTRDQVEELRYASKLHDFGKVAVPEKVLKKEKKLLASELKSIELRLAYRATRLEAEHLRRKLEGIDSKQLSAAQLAALDARYAEECRELERILGLVRLANEPRLVAEKGIDALEEAFSALQALPVRNFDNNWDQEQEFPLEQWASGPFLSERERAALLIRKGSLTDEERFDPREGINSHVQHTYEFLRKIPWTGELRRIPEIAWAHHEKLDGSGYPQGLTAKKIPVQSKMMTISDIFDALRAWDRPYKRAVTPEKALDILKDEVKRGKLDEDLLSVFIETRIWDSSRYLEELKDSEKRGKAGR
ncbi:MAG: HD domain-containing phosphohydrolase [Vicinamibacteria bacterium]